MSKSGTIQSNGITVLQPLIRCLGILPRHFFLWRVKVFKRVHAEPTGKVTFEYGNYSLTIDRDGVAKIKSIMFNKGNHGSVDSIRNNSVKHISDQLP